MDKIQNIRNNLTENPTYKPTRKSISSLAEFRPFNQMEVKKINHEILSSILEHNFGLEDTVSN